MKKCCRCKEFKELNQFNKRTSAKDKKDSYCKICKEMTDKLWRMGNKEKKAFSDKRWRQNNKTRLTVYFTEYRRERRRTDIMTKLRDNLRRRLHKALKGKAKSQRTMQLLGASIETVLSHIENLFLIGMSWENYGKWHLDHKIPLASAKNTEELEKLFHYSNLQPLWAIDNIKKSDIVPQHNL